MAASLAGSKVRLVTVGKTGRWDILGPLSRLRRLFRTERPDVIYAFLPMQNVLAALLRVGSTPARLIFGARASGMRLSHYDRLSAMSYRAEAWLSGCADLIIANAESFRADAAVRGFRNKKIVVIPNAIDTEVNRIDPGARNRMRGVWGVDPEVFVIGMVARLDPMKDHRNCLLAAADFTKRNGPAKFVFVGDGPAAYRAKLLAMAGDLGLSDSVVFSGEQNDVMAAYNAFDVSTLSSAFGEGFPNVVGEAMACGTPVVATDVGDARLIVGDLGILVPPNNPRALSDGWKRMRERMNKHPELRQQVRERVMTQYGVDRLLKQTESILAETFRSN